MEIKLHHFEKDTLVEFVINLQKFELPIDGYNLSEYAKRTMCTHGYSSSMVESISDTLSKMMMQRESKKTGKEAKYKAYFKDVSKLDEVDVYLVCKIFNIQDPSGCTQHAIKKLLLPGVRTGGKSELDDIKEARDTLNRRIEIHDL